MIDVERPLLRDELLLRDWEVKSIVNCTETIEHVCGYMAPDFIYASTNAGLRKLSDTLLWARSNWGSLHLVIESETGTQDEWNGLKDQDISLQDVFDTGTIWVSDDTLLMRLLRLKSKTMEMADCDVKSHNFAQLVAQFMTSECEIGSHRAWPIALTELPQTHASAKGDTDDDIESKDEDADHKQSVVHVDEARSGKQCIATSKPKASNPKSSVALQARSTKSSSQSQTDCSVVEGDVELLPYLFEKDTFYLSLRDDTKRAQYRALKNTLYLRVDVRTDEMMQAWHDWCASEQPFDLDALVRNAEAIASAAMYSTQNLALIPYVGMKVRKRFGGEYFIGIISREDNLGDDDNDEGGKQVKVWKVDFEDGDQEEFEYTDLLKFSQHRNRIPAPLLGRAFRALEMYSGRSVVTDHFFNMLYRVVSIDSDRRSNATRVMDALGLKTEHIVSRLGGLPDFIWASPPCETYSKLKGGKDRNVRIQNWERTEVARQHNFHLAKVIEVMSFVLKNNKKAIFVIENPEGAMDSSPLMIMAKRVLGLRKVSVHYCTFGRDEQKATVLWTNSANLADRLSMYDCCNLCAHGGRGKHPNGVRGNSTVAHCVIPEALALVVARYVDALLEQASIRFTP